MYRLHLDYQRSFKPFPLIGVALVVAAIVVAFQIGRQYAHFTEVLDAWEDYRARLVRITHDQGGGGGAGSVRDKEQLPREVSRANEVLRRITLPWSTLFGAVESTVPKDVALLSLEPDPEKQDLKIAGEAKDVAAMLTYIRALEGKPIFRSVTLQNHQIQQQDPQQPIRFTVVATWKEGT